MDLKLTLLFFLIGAVISLSHLGRKNLIKLQSEFDGQHQRNTASRDCLRPVAVGLLYAPLDARPSVFAIGRW